MELRHLRCFLAVAQELHFARAAEKLHIEQSPLSRAIKELEEELGVRLFDRNTRSTRLTRSGQVFMDHVPRVFAALTQARDSVRAVSAGYQRQLRIALSEDISQARLTALLSGCREEEPDTEIRLYEVPLAQQIKGLESDLYDLGFSQWTDVGEALSAVPAWSDTIVVVMPLRHPLLAYEKPPLNEVLRYPLVLCDPEVCEGCCRQLDRVLRATDMEPIVAERVASHDLMVTLVAAGYGLGFSTEAHVSTSSHPEIVTRPLAGRTPLLTTYLIHRIGDPSETLRRFVERALINAPDRPANDAQDTSPGSTT
ncbi:D-alanyl-D-alanine endopeptidase [Variovorax paradoxus]|jgi:DNA-binding transcriptional LysR family regulator|uniref:LysR family transcriptional regulator n=2 Tax=Burkholderiales TaxID=80840 RepID=A0ABZ0D2I1_9BURK|nr:MULTISPECIES: LysR family transcriptional regulator [Burkholderiales]KPU88773.1 D-alanyl-D-alanine endopeptidase [Variovorax paradoxus]KPU90152.1 D-alanyl-D-alanine endopeptidase [Variovorax paradoxus]KPU94161.1 D-alanyl-D-alanine endopeptidase [Variovorax paradoxus]KPV10967.1 D-alanyl-D-alanine endopeptidase [Variovorax paradoxus]KPV17743.1 D-alanyl-D-alanine endopeptidase [Variovorax paradoxus]